MDMVQLFLWGAGEKAEFVYKAINREKCNILGVIDIDDKKKIVVGNMTILWFLIRKLLVNIRMILL